MALVDQINFVSQRGHALRASSAMSQLPDKVQAITDAVAALNSVRAPHALIGGLAVGIHSGIPRATLDVDFAVHSKCSLDELVKAMTEHGFVHTGSFPHSINFKHRSGEPTQLAVDAAFDPMIERAETVTSGSTMFPLVTKNDLIAMKRRAAADPRRRRSKALRDQADIALLEGDIPDENEGW